MGNGAEEGSEDGLDVSVPGDDGERVVGLAECGLESLVLEEAVTCATYDLQGWVVVGHC